MKTKIVLLIVVGFSVFFIGCQDHRIKQIEGLQTACAEAKKAGNLDEAIALTRKIQQLDPNEVGHLDSLAILYLKTGAFKAAEAVADSGIELIPSKESLRVAIACAKQLEHYLKGEEYTYLLLSLGEPVSAALLFDLAWFQFHSWQYEKCTATLNQILSVSNYRYILRRESVISNGEEVMVNIPLFAVCYNMMGACEYKNGWTGKAITAFELALEIDPTYTAAAENLQVLLSD